MSEQTNQSQNTEGATATSSLPEPQIEVKSALEESASVEFNYSDGDEVENYIYQVISQSRDISLGSPELAAAIRDWPSQYHLSPLRGNLLKGFPFPKGASALEIGSGCGAITRLLGEAGLKVTAVEGSPRRARIGAARCRDLENVEVITSNIDTFSTTERFDFIFLIGVLEYAPSFIEGPDPIQRLLSICRALLKPVGTLVIAIENRLGLKFLNGAPEDHIGRQYWGVQDLYGEKSPVTFGLGEIREQLRLGGFGGDDLYLPFPDYKLPELLISEKALTQTGFCPGELLHQTYSGGNGHSFQVSFDEPLVWSLLGKNGLIAELSNSFLIFAHSLEMTTQEVTPDWLAVLFSGTGAETTFLASPTGEISVQKKTKTPRSTRLFEAKTERAAYVAGEQYQNVLRRVILRDGTISDIAQWTRPWLELLKKASSGEPGAEVLPENFVDCVPYNLIQTQGDELQYIDREWNASTPPPLRWVFIRGLVHTIWRCGWKGVLVGLTYREAVRSIGALLGVQLSDTDFASAIELETTLIEAASGTAPLNAFRESLDSKIENTIQFWPTTLSEQHHLLTRAKAEIDYRDSRLSEANEAIEETRLKTVELQASQERLANEQQALFIERTSLKQLAHSRLELLEREKNERREDGQRIEQLTRELDELKARAKHSEEQLAQVLNSKSWRVTAPLRAATERLKGR